MNKPNPAPEPTMEEILASIRRIISDGEDSSRQVRPAPAPHMADDETDDSDAGEADIFDLTDEMVAEEQVDAAPAMPRPAPMDDPFEPEAAPDYYAAGPVEPTELTGAAETVGESYAIAPESLVDPDQIEVAFGEPAEPVAGSEDYGTPPEPEGRPAREPQPAMNHGAPPPETAAASGLLSPQADAMVASAFGRLATTILSRDARTLEDLVSEMMRPMLKEWLDDNLPVLVERLVREEIERVSRGRR